MELREAADVTQVAHVIVPAPVMVPPAIGAVVATLVTVPLEAAFKGGPDIERPVPSVSSAGGAPLPESPLPRSLELAETF